MIVVNLYVTDPSTIPAPPPSTEEDLSEFLVPVVDEIEIDVVSEVDRTDQMAAMDFTALNYDLDEYEQ